MCAPATAALFLAAITALPCQGTDADSAARALPEARNLNTTEFPPTINKVYQMLHTRNINLHKQTKLSYNFNNSDPNLKPNLNLPGNLRIISLTIDSSYCCPNSLVNNVNSVNQPGAKYIVKDRNIVKNKLKRRRRGVSVVRVDDVSKDYKNHTEVSSVVATTAAERRRRPGETGSSAALLNYIFDTHSNTHHHRNDRAGNGNSIYAAATPEVKALVGTTAHLDCKVDALHDKLVSWVRRKNDDEAMELLTTGTQLYTSDQRYSARFIPPDIWRLEVRDVQSSDAANYDCQLSAHPPRTARVTLHVPEVSVRIVDGAGASVSEQVCERGSTVALRCEVRGLRMEGGPALLWYRRDDLLNDDTTRGGISVRTEFGPNGANSVLRVARVRADDAGRYTCSVAHAPPAAQPPAHVILHVIKGESLAELHQGGACAALHTHMLIVAAAAAVALCT